MDKVYNKVGDKFVAGTKVYDGGDGYAYADSDLSIKIPETELQELFIQGIIVIDGTDMYKPISYFVAAGVGTLTFVKTDGVTPTTAELATLVSEEYVA